MTASVTYPSMNGFGGLGINPTMFAWYEVFAADPLDSRHLIAPDVINEKMMQTWDGGDNWAEIPLLTSLVTEAGRFQFRNWIFPHASAVSFYSADPNRVAIGTQQGGIFVSTDRGATWFKVPGSERATYITSIEWRNANDLFVSTYGRGLWRVQAKLTLPNIDRYCLIVNCLFRYIDKGDPVPDRFKHGILVYEGRVQGVRVERGVLRQLFISPGASIGFIGDNRQFDKVAVSETAKFVGMRGAAQDELQFAAKQAAPVGIAVDERSKLIGALFTAGNLPLDEEPPPTHREKPECEDDEDQVPESPTANKPYIRLSLDGRAADVVGPGDKLTISGVRVKPGTVLELLMDSRPVEKATANQDGSFSVVVTAPPEFGLHTVSIRDVRSRAMIDATMFIVRHRDSRDARDEEGRKDQEKYPDKR